MTVDQLCGGEVSSLISFKMKVIGGNLCVGRRCGGCESDGTGINSLWEEKEIEGKISNYV